MAGEENWRSERLELLEKPDGNPPSKLIRGARRQNIGTIAIGGKILDAADAARQVVQEKEKHTEGYSSSQMRWLTV